jgi:hypothetical protein
MEANKDPFSGLATGLAQGLEIGQNRQRLQMQAQEQQRAALMAQAKEHYNKLKEDADFNLKIASDKSFSPDARKNSWNAVQASKKAMDKTYQPMFIDKWDPVTASALDDIGVMQQKMTKGEVDPQMFNKFQVDRIKQVMLDPAASQAEKESAMQVMKAVQDTNTTELVNIHQGKTNQQMNRDKLGNLTPIVVDGQKATSPDVPQLNYELSQEQFEESKKAKGLSAETAGKTSGSQSAIKDVQDVRNLLIGPDGKLDRLSILAGKFSIPLTKGREANRLMRRSIETKLRLDTGATAKKEEVDALMESFAVELGDKDKFAAEKLDRFEEIMTNFQFQIDPQGKYVLSDPKAPPSAKESPLQAELRKRKLKK